VCGIDPFCCDVAWDSICAGEAQQLCGSPVCGVTPNSCAEPHGQPGCNDAICCKKVCLIDPFCCEVAWDAICVQEALDKGCAEPTSCKEDLDDDALGLPYNPDGDVDVTDLVTLILNWGCQTPPADKCVGDVNNDGDVDVLDLVELILAWGPCVTQNFIFSLSGLEEVPPNASPATGQATVTFNKNTLELSWNISYQGLLGPITAAHFHGPAMPGQNAGVQVGIGALPSPMIGAATLTPAQATQLQSGLWYVNIHSTVFPGGEIRGQVD
jgi:hypothetical protein